MKVHPWTKAEFREMMVDHFRKYRQSPRWEKLREFYERKEDQEYFDILERHYKAGKLKVEVLE